MDSCKSLLSHMEIEIMLSLASDDIRRVRLEAEVPIPVLFLTLTVDSNVYRMTDAPKDLTVDGNLYESTESLIQTSSPGHSPPTEPDGWTLTLAESNETGQSKWHQILSGQYTNTFLEVHCAFLSSDFLELSDLLHIYRGRGSGVKTTLNQNSLQTVISFTGPLAKLDSQFSRYTTAESQRAANSNDSSMDFAHEVGRDLSWGS